MPGQYQDSETGFHYNYHRYYDSRTGRYLSPDPIGQVGGINLYTYVGNNPINAVDPEGLYIIGKLVTLGYKGMKTLGRLTFRRAVEEAKAGEDVLIKNRKVAEEVARAVGGGMRPIHDLPHGPVSAGYRPHYHSFGHQGGHIFYSILAFLGSLIDPFDAISGELASDEEYLEMLRAQQNGVKACE